MWNPLIDAEENPDGKTKEKKVSGIFFYLRKYKTFLYIFLSIFIIYAFVIFYYERNETWVDKSIDCNIAETECKDFQFRQFDPDRLLIVDVNLKNNNFLLRSNIPFFDGKLSEEKLLSEIKNKIEESNLKFKNNYSLYIISLLKNSQLENCYIASEKCYADKAIIDNQPLFGSSVDPYDLTKKELEVKLKNLSWNTDDLLNRIKTLSDKFENMKNTIFLIHCREGKDRTGEYVGAYRMFVKKTPLNIVIKANRKVGLLKENFVKMQKWFCLYLEKVLNYETLKCFDYQSEDLE